LPPTGHLSSPLLLPHSRGNIRGSKKRIGMLMQWVAGRSSEFLF
jgi:hypothetical protein